MVDFFKMICAQNVKKSFNVRNALLIRDVARNGASRLVICQDLIDKAIDQWLRLHMPFE